MPVNASQTQQHSDAAHVQRVIALLEAELGANRIHSMNTFAAAYAGPKGPFGMGQAKLKEIIRRAVTEGHIEVSKGKEKTLTACTPTSPPTLGG